MGSSLHTKAQSTGRADFSPILQRRKLRAMEAMRPVLGNMLSSCLVFSPKLW